MKKLHRIACASFLGSLAFSMSGVDACSRAVYFGKQGQTVTGRTMDWMENMHSDLWIFPRGMKRDGGMGKVGYEWTSKYGSVVASVYEGGTADGMNEKGLVTNMLYLSESIYPSGQGDDRPQMTITAWAQYVLDSFSTVSEAVEELSKDKFRMVTVVAPNGSHGTVHLSISDPSGDSAIVEYIGGELKIHHSRDYQVMTNSPAFDQQLALNEYWKQIGGTTMLPGTNRAADRFARASFYINATEQSADSREATAAVFSVMRNVSVPRGISTPSQPNIASTLWRTVADQKNLVYYFEDTFSPSIIWIDLKKIDFGAGTGSRKLELEDGTIRIGDQTNSFEKAEPFKFLAPE